MCKSKRRIIIGDVQRATNQRRQGDEVVLCRLPRRGELVPFERQGRGQMRLAEGEADNLFGVGAAEGAGVEEDLVCAWGGEC